MDVSCGQLSKETSIKKRILHGPLNVSKLVLNIKHTVMTESTCRTMMITYFVSSPFGPFMT